jgi:hypothetical protein
MNKLINAVEDNRQAMAVVSWLERWWLWIALAVALIVFIPWPRSR